MRKSLMLSLVVMLFTMSLFAGVSGKIEGVVRDAQNDLALAGVNVLIEGTTMGAATDNDGYYVILNVPAGS